MASHIHGLDRCVHAFAGEEVHWLCGMQPVYTNKATANTVDPESDWVRELVDLSALRVSYTIDDDGLHLWCEECESELLGFGPNDARSMYAPTLHELVELGRRHLADTLVARQPIPDAEDLAEHDAHEQSWVHEPYSNVQNAERDAEEIIAGVDR